MKKTIILLAVALMAIPAWAGVTVTGSDLGSGVGQITYTMTTPRVRAFALDITVDNGATITAVTVGTSRYTVYPGTIQISGNTVDNPGTPVAVPTQLPGGTQAGIGTSGVTLEMASLYVGDANAPLATDQLVTITVDKSCHVTIAQNAGRGGVVMEDLSAVTPTLTGFDINISTLCLGDLDGDTWVTSDDFAILMNKLIPYAPDYAYPVNPADPQDLAADMDGDTWVTSDDFAILMNQLIPYAPDYAFPCP